MAAHLFLVVGIAGVVGGVEVFQFGAAGMFWWVSFSAAGLAAAVVVCSWVGDVVTVIAALFPIVVQFFGGLGGQVNPRSLWRPSDARARSSRLLYLLVVQRSFARREVICLAVVVIMHPPQLMGSQAGGFTHFALAFW
jgi:hypothetical protein